MFRKILILLLGIFLIIFGVFKLKKDKPIEEPGYLKFLNGNALVKENKNQEALEEYKIAMDTNEDLNIKKNFEIIKNKVDKEKQDQQQQQNNKDQQHDNKQNQQNQQNDKNQQDNQDNKNNSQDNKQNEQQNDNQDKKQENQQNSGNKQQNQGSAPKELTPEEKAMKQKEEELRSIMQRLEGNEKQAFKNNERVLNTSENKNSENRW